MCRIELQDMGPVVELSMRRSRLASDEARRAACKVPKVLTSAYPLSCLSTDVGFFSFFNFAVLFVSFFCAL